MDFRFLSREMWCIAGVLDSIAVFVEEVTFSRCASVSALRNIALSGYCLYLHCGISH